jgi:DNA-binding response OmpR family regulator
VLFLHPADVKTVLIADDEPNIVTALEFLLRQGGYEVRIARDGDEALRLAASCDLVLLDVMMPLRSGYDVCTEIRRQPGGERLRIVMLSAKGGQAEVERGLQAGADLYVTKPFSNRELMSRIDGLLSR